MPEREGPRVDRERAGRVVAVRQRHQREDRIAMSSQPIVLAGCRDTIVRPIAR